MHRTGTAFRGWARRQACLVFETAAARGAGSALETVAIVFHNQWRENGDNSVRCLAPKDTIECGMRDKKGCLEQTCLEALERKGKETWVLEPAGLSDASQVTPVHVHVNEPRSTDCEASPSELRLVTDARRWQAHHGCRLL